MATRNMSPGGALLRTSRLFALPPPILPPHGKSTARSRVRSDSATLAFPTHQIITTDAASRRRGDWGLKRPFPIRTTIKSSTPMIRVHQVDSLEQITDFASAADYGVTLKKWQDLNMPITAPPNRDHDYGGPPRASVFEEAADFTAFDPAKPGEAEAKRWKFTGPWLAGMTDGDFKKWVLRHVRPKRAAFRVFLKTQIAAERSKASQNNAQENGELLGQELHTVAADSITDDDLVQFLRRIREERASLYKLVGRFLDLAPLEPPKHDGFEKALRSLSPISLMKRTGNPYAATGPPVTHPSAGLSYLRTTSYIDNHPLYGPQAYHPPVEARVVASRPRHASGRSPSIGVAGFIASLPPDSGGKGNSMRGPQVRAFDKFDPRIEGGAKVWVQPDSSYINSDGQVMLKVKLGDPKAVCIAGELLGLNTVYSHIEREAEYDPASRDFTEYKRNSARRHVHKGRQYDGNSERYGMMW